MSLIVWRILLSPNVRNVGIITGLDGATDFIYIYFNDKYTSDQQDNNNVTVELEHYTNIFLWFICADKLTLAIVSTHVWLHGFACVLQFFGTAILSCFFH